MTTTKDTKENQPSRKNHTVPKCLLKRWLDQSGADQGHWVLDCPTNGVYFHASKGAEFAIRDYRYVPLRELVEGKALRDESLEKWFAQGENDFSLVIDRIVAGEPSKAAEDKFGGFLQAAILLGFRSWYEYDCAEQDFGSCQQRCRVLSCCFS